MHVVALVPSVTLRPLSEFAPLLALVLLAWFVRSIPARAWAFPTHLLRRLAGGPKQAILSSAAVTLALCMALSVVRPPSAAIHDEFSYLLGADTFAHGRITNPTHPLWRHFESFHLIHQPTYQSKYPPGQALFLAAGQALTGEPIVGVWLSMALGAAAVCWMLLAWMPPRWAFFGALLPALRFGTLPVYDSTHYAYWSTTFWGGAVAMLGGALLFGALPRLLRAPAIRDACLLGAGLGVLANSRPFEGLVAALPAVALLSIHFFKNMRQWKSFALRAALPAAGVLGVGALAMGYYDYRVTGDPLKMPYQVHVEQYEVAPRFVFQPLNPDKTYNHQVIRDYHYGFLLDAYNQRRQYTVSLLDFIEPALFFWGYALMPPLFWMLGRSWSSWMAFATLLIVGSILAAKLAATSVLHFHYLAAVAPWFVFAAVASLRRVRAWRLRGRRIGRALAEGIVAVCVLSFAASYGNQAAFMPRYRSDLAARRPAIERRLEASSGKDLVIVTYLPNHNTHSEWAYNGADLDEAPILWARDMGPERNKELLEYYSGRRIWRLRADEDPPVLEPYSDR
jgi:hypothetical protein